MINPPIELTCFEYKRRLEGGFSRPFLFAAHDKNNREYNVVVKVRKPDSTNHFGATSLACEMICSVLLRSSGLATPDYAIVYVSEDLANSIPITEDRRLMAANKGKNFGTVFYKGATTWYPHRQPVISDSHLFFAKDVLTFDSTVVNGDRKADKPNILQTGRELLLIDHSLALPVCRWTTDQVDTSPLFPETEVRNHCGFQLLNNKARATGSKFDFTELLGVWNTVFNAEEWKTIRGFIPHSWEEKPGELDKIFHFLQARSLKFPEISDSLRNIVQ